jgi:VanZ family protein
MLKKLWPALVWALIILVLTGIPGKYIPEVKTFWDWLSYDKLVHLFMFGTFSFLLLNGLREQYFNSRYRLYYVAGFVILSMAYGLLTEVLQARVFIGRDGNVYDFLADSVGAILGWLVFHLRYRKRNYSGA